MVAPLLFGHGDEQALVRALGEIRQHLLLRAPHQNGGQALLDPVEVAVPHDPARIVRLLVFVEKAEQGPQVEAVDELDDGMELLEAVLERRAGQDHRVFRVDLLDGFGAARLPIFDPLRLVEDHHLR